MARPNIICLVIDQLRASAVGAYGAAACDTPALDRLASESFVLDHALVANPDLDAVYRSLWQGLHPLAAADRALNAPTIASVLGEQGYWTTLLADETHIAEHPLAADFDECVRLAIADDDAPATAIEETHFGRFFASAIDSLDLIERRAVDAPFLLWLHSRGLSAPWDAPYDLRASLADEEDPDPPEFTQPPRGRLAADHDPDELLGVTQAYGGQVIALDACLGAFLEDLATRELLANTIFVLLSARGFPLGEHGRVGLIDQALFGELTHIPWIMRFPERLAALVRSQALVQASDLAATLAAAVAIEWPAGNDSKSLMPIVHGDSDTVRDHIVLATPNERAIRTPAWLLRVPTGVPPQLYVKPDDRWEANEVSDRCLEVVAGLTDAIAVFAQSLQSPDGGEIAPLADTLVEPLD